SSNSCSARSAAAPCCRATTKAPPETVRATAADPRPAPAGRNEGRTRRFTRLMARFPIPGPARSTELRLGERPGAAGRDIRRGWRDGAPDARPRLGRYAARPARAVAEQPESRSAPAAHLEVRDVAGVGLRHPLL